MKKSKLYLGKLFSKVMFFVFYIKKKTLIWVVFLVLDKEILNFIL